MKSFTGTIVEQVMNKLVNSLGEQELLELSKDPARLETKANAIAQELY